MLIKAILVGLVLGLCKSEWIYGFPQVGRPIVVSTLTGLFLGDPVQGVIMGSVLELMFIGSFPIGAAVSPDYTSAGAICTAFAILTGGGKAVATAMALPIALLGGFIFIGCKLMNAAFGQIMMKYLEKDDSKGASRIYIMGSVFTCFVVYFAYAFVCIFAGSAAVEAAVEVAVLLEEPPQAVRAAAAAATPTRTGSIADQLSAIHCAPSPIVWMTGSNVSRRLFLIFSPICANVIGIDSNSALILSADANMAFFTIVAVILPWAAISRIFPIGTSR